MNIPSDLLYTEDHEWARKEADGSVRVGITDFAQSSLGGVVYVELPGEDSELTQGDSFGQVESTKSVSELYAPLSGAVVEVNPALETQPELVNTDPYGAGWLIRVTPTAAAELGKLMNPEAYAAHVAAAAAH